VGGVVVAAALIVMKLLPVIPGSFGKFEYIALGAWVALGVVLGLRRRREKAI
jgi:MYXO-CTERM domain-containing protein